MAEPVDRDAGLLARRRRRSIALALVLGALVVIFYVLTIVKMGPGLFERPL
ncbi:MAG: hypothetical protein Q8L54_14410 [Devosia sp.]|nr:hypothetical protein [Devosia sp.]